ncbi:MAG: hypothetical protein FJW88_06160 [Actinobacteria bacterium]|nr:hypothetical protein [Actinomycetota bacterium]
MLWLERRVVASLSENLDHAQRESVAAFVEGCLRSMPELLRFGVAAESVVLGAAPWLRERLGRSEGPSIAARMARWERNPVGPIRQYPRLLSSLVLFATEELVPAGSK